MWSPDRSTSLTCRSEGQERHVLSEERDYVVPDTEVDFPPEELVSG